MPVDDFAGSYYRAGFAEFYDQFYDIMDREDVGFYVDQAKQTGGPVLELGCGTGRVLIPTAREGLHVTGVDLSEHMMAVFRAKLAQESVEVQGRTQIVCADIRDFALGTQFNLVTVPFRPFQHLITVDEQMACLSAARRHLMPGGRLALDVFNPNLSRLVDENRQEVEEMEPRQMADGRTVSRSYRTDFIDLDNQVLHIELIYYVTGVEGEQERTVHAFPMRYFFRYEMEHLLARAGFEVEALYGDFERSPYGSKYPGELIFVARRA